MSSTKKESEKAWVRLPLALLKAEGITPTDCNVLAVIIDKCYEHTDRKCHIERQKIAAAVGCSVRQVSASVRKLIELQLIERHDTGRVAVYVLTGAVSVLGPKRQKQPTAPARSSRRPTAAAPDPDFDVEGYLSTVNRICTPAPPPDPWDTPLDGQLDFPVFQKEG